MRGGWFNTQLAAYALGLLMCGCASSSSDTPWPTQPDFERLRAEARGQAGPSRQGAEWSPREPEGDELPEPEREAPSTWGGVAAEIDDEDEPPPLRAGTVIVTPAPSLRPPGAKPPPPAAKPPAKPGATEDFGDTDEIDSDPFFKDDEDED